MDGPALSAYERFRHLAQYIQEHIPAGEARSEANTHLAAALDKIYDALGVPPEGK